MTTLFNYDPYYDDFNEDKNFMRVLFRPGYSVQARELTQLQTILSNQIEKFGNHIFKSGSPIIGGKVSLDTAVNYILLNAQYNNADIVPSDYLNKTIVSYNSTKLARAKVIAVDTVGTNPVLVIKYLSGDRFVENDELKIYGQNIYAQLKDANAYGTSYVASIQDGIYYFKGQFVKVTPQFLVVELFYRLGTSTTVNTQPSYKIGIEFESTIVDEVDDTSLLDPAQGAFNYQAPGAERFQINTTLSKRALDSVDVSSFFEVIRLVDGVKTKEIDYPIYSEIEKMLARRTYDESGNYTVDPFVISIDEGDSANGKFNVVLDPGKAYVGGYEFETIAPTTIKLDRAREVANTEGYSVSTNYESYVVLDSVYGTLDITSYPLLDVHSVAHTSVNTTTTAAYNSTKIGEIRANMMDYNDSTTLEIGTTHSFTVHTFAANATSITGTTQSSGSNTRAIRMPAGFSSTVSTDAYANMYFRITDTGGSSIAPVLIQGSNATHIYLSSAWPIIPASNTFSIDSDFKNAEAFVVKTGTAKTFAGNINSDSKDATTGFAMITEPQRSSLVFDVPFQAMKPSTLTNMDFYAKKFYGNKTADAGGVISISAEGTDTFSFCGSPGVISDSNIRDNIICMVRYDTTANATSGIVANTVLGLANNLFTVTAISSTNFEIDLNTAGAKVDLLINTKVNNAENASSGAIRGKQLIPSTAGLNLHSLVPSEFTNGAGTQGVDILYTANTSSQTLVSGVGYVFNTVGSTFFDDTTTLTDLRTPGKAVSLQVPDVLEIVRITDSRSPAANVTTAMLSSSTYDVTNNYDFDNGQRKTHYDHATITLKRGYSAPRGKVYVTYKYLNHQSAPSPQNDGLFTVDSYLKSGSNFTYNEIFYFNNKEDNKLIPLRSAFDFRPTRGIGTTTISGAVNPLPNQSLTSNFDYYLGRIDRIVVKQSRDFEVLTGTSAIKPIAPNVNPGDMLIYTLAIPAYTENVKDIRADFQNHRRYTMQDIGAFENRIKQLEYYVTLNSLEQDASATKITDANGLERSKYGILTDNFTSDSIKAPPNQIGFDNRCLIDKGELKPASLMRTINLKANTTLSTGQVYGVNEQKIMMLGYTTSVLAQQPYATKSSPIAGALYGTFKGTMRLFPEFTGDVDSQTTARVILNSNQGIENAFNFVNDAFKYIADNVKQWSDDKNSPFAQIADSKWYQTRTEEGGTVYKYLGTGGFGHGEFWDPRQGKNTQGGVWGVYQAYNDNTYLTTGAELNQNQVTTSASQQSVGEVVTDLAIQPYMKSKQVLFTTNGLRPSTSVYSFFDDVNVNKYVVVPNKVTMNANTTLIAGEPVLIASSTADLVANLVSLLSGGSSYKLGDIAISETGSANVSIINQTGLSLAGKYVYGLDSGKTLIISSVDDHRSGVGTVSSATIVLDGNASSNNDFYNGNTVSIVHTSTSEEGIGEQFTISSYVGSTRTATLSGTPTTQGSVVYSIGTNKTNKYGQAGGAFYIPPATFRSGQRNFRVTESFNNTYDGDSISYTDKLYVASGLSVSKTELVDTVYNYDVDSKIVGTTTSDRLMSSRFAGATQLYTYNHDPLAETFYIDPARYPYGIFLNSVDLFFKAKDSELPVWIQIRPTVNGVPSSDFWYPESVVTKVPSQVNISETPSVDDATTITNFQFYTPIFLKPGLYAVVVLTDSPDYILWEAEKGQLSTSNQYIGVNPYVGTLYRSQNSMEYVPYINEDLMFRLNRCSFSTSPAQIVMQSEEQGVIYSVDKVRLLETSIVPTGTSVNYSLKANTISGSMETNYRPIVPQAVISFEADDLYAVGYRRKTLGYKGDFTILTELSTTDEAVSPVVSVEKAFLNIWENYVDNAEVNAEDFTIVASGTGYGNSNVIVISSSTGTGFSGNLSCDASGNILSVYVSAPGSGYIDDYTITIGANTNYPAVAASGANGSVVLNTEYDSSGGPCLARYITRQIQLAPGFDAGDLRVFLTANKPLGTSVDVFCKLLSGSDGTQFKDRRYQKLVNINPTVAQSLTPYDFTDYEYRPSATDNFITYTSGNGVTYDTFATFSIKIVLRSSDPTIVPKVKDLRVIALPAE